MASVLKGDWSNLPGVSAIEAFDVSPTPFRISLLASLGFHAFIILGVGIALPQTKLVKNYSQPLEVILVNAKSVTRPPKAESLAQANLDGGGNTDAKKRAKSPLPVLPKETRNLRVEKTESRVQQLEQEAKKLLTAIKSEQTVNPPEPKPDTEAREGDTLRAEDIVARSLEIARLQAQIDKDWQAYQKRPRRTFVGARAQSFALAQYVEDWRLKIERVGTLNYPYAARQQRLFGTLQLTVAIKADGSVERIEIERSSGKKILDQAALRIVDLAAPFAPLPSDVRKTTDILHITRTWTFTRSDQLVTE